MFTFSHLKIYNVIWTLLAVTIAIFFSKVSGELPKLYTNEFAVQLEGGHEEANSLAKQYNLINRGQIGSLQGYYLFEAHRLAKRSLNSSSHHHTSLRADRRVRWVEQQHAKRRVKRELAFSSIPDPLYSQQWYLSHGAKDGYDMNVLPAWQAGYTGKGVVVTILDDGIQTNHPDLLQNYDPRASTDINGRDEDPTPMDDNKNKHGTRCAGEVAATAFNEFCGIGIAFNASIGGVRMLDGTVTDEVEARALSLNRDHIHIYSASWGPEDDGKTVDGPGKLARKAFVDGVTRGRRGLGSIFVWASGNGGRFRDNCNCDGYTNSIYTLSISSATQEGLKPWYLEECSSTLATTYSSGTFGQDRSVVTVDMDTSYYQRLSQNQVPDLSRLCTKSHTGTSASAPLAAGICALALEANPTLTWRDMQYIVLMTSRPQPLLHVDGWAINGVGRRFSHKFGYGMMDAAAMVSMARTWAPVPPQVVCNTPTHSDNWAIHPNVPLEVTLSTEGCRGTPQEVNYLEHVQVVLSLSFQPRGSLYIALVSPMGTRSSLLLPRPYDTDQHALTDWPFLSVHFWGENPRGVWTLQISAQGGARLQTSGTLFQWALVLYGTTSNPIGTPTAFNRTARHDIREASRISPCGKERKFEYKETCERDCPMGYYGDQVLWTCEKCNTACLSCYGPMADNCLSCPVPKLLLGDLCLAQCPTGFYEEVTLRECLACDKACNACLHHPNLCQSCHPGHFLARNSVCAPRCPPGFYPDTSDRKCKHCNQSCWQCALSPDNCVSCPRYHYLHGNSCLDTCPPRYFPNRVSYCESCPQGCKECEGPDGHCMVCEADWTLKAVDGVDICVPNCETSWKCNCEVENCKQCADSRDCHRCQTGWLSYEGRCFPRCPGGWWPGQEGACRPCPSSCQQCSGPSDCQRCSPGLVVHMGSCKPSCPPGWFRPPGGEECQKCNESCKECEDGASNCTECAQGKHLLPDRGCVAHCPAGHYPDSRAVCKPCHHHCQQCQGPTPASCIACPPQARLYQGTCLPCPARHFFNHSLDSCEPCAEGCERCSGPGKDQCQECPGGMGLDPKQGCLPCCDSPTRQAASHLPCCQCDSRRCLVPTSSSTFTYAVVGACLVSVLAFFLLFGGLQASSQGWCRGVSRYRLLHAAKFDPAAERVSLTTAEEEEEELEELNGTLPKA